MTQYEQLKAVVAWLADSFAQEVGKTTPADLTYFFRNTEYGPHASYDEYLAISEEYDLDALDELWNDGEGWSLSDLAGLIA